MNNAKKYIKNLQAKSKADAMLNGFSYNKQTTFEMQEKKKKNEKVIELAKMVYDSYLPQGVDIALEKRDLYVERNSIK